MSTSQRAVDLPPGAVTRTAVGAVPLLVLWGLAFTGTTPFYPTLLVGGAAMVVLSWWVWAAPPPWRSSPTPDGGDHRSSRIPAPFPSLTLDARTAWTALVVAVVHYLVGAALYRAASRFVPEFAQTASATYDRAEVVPLWVAVLLGGLISAPLEEVFWRGAAQPVITGVLVRRWPAMWDRPVIPIAASALAYALFHAATGQLALVAAAMLGGLVWGWLLHRTGSLAAVMIAHASWTMLMLLVPPGAA